MRPFLRQGVVHQFAVRCKLLVRKVVVVAEPIAKGEACVGFACASLTDVSRADQIGFQFAIRLEKQACNDSYSFDYIRDFGESSNYCKLLKINGRGERI